MESDVSNWLKLLTTLLESHQNLCVLSLKAKFYFTAINGLYGAYKFNVRNHSWKIAYCLISLQKNREWPAQETLHWSNGLWENATPTNYFCPKDDKRGQILWNQRPIGTTACVSTSQTEGEGLKLAETYEKTLTQK